MAFTHCCTRKTSYVESLKYEKFKKKGKHASTFKNWTQPSNEKYPWHGPRVVFHTSPIQVTFLWGEWCHDFFWFWLGGSGSDHGFFSETARWILFQDVGKVFEFSMCNRLDVYSNTLRHQHCSCSRVIDFKSILRGCLPHSYNITWGLMDATFTPQLAINLSQWTVKKWASFQQALPSVEVGRFLMFQTLKAVIVFEHVENLPHSTSSQHPTGKTPNSAVFLYTTNRLVVWDFWTVNGIISNGHSQHLQGTDSGRRWSGCPNSL